LLKNTVKFADPKEGIVTISAEKDNSKNEAVVTISYNGQGIDAELLPKLFSKFVSKLEQGTGLGLFIAKSIINPHGGIFGLLIMKREELPLS
jgi:two-component system, OmpR family, sensor histidine kinase VicK